MVTVFLPVFYFSFYGSSSQTFSKYMYSNVKILKYLQLRPALTKTINLDVWKPALRLLATYVDPDPAQEKQRLSAPRRRAPGTDAGRG